MRTTGCICPVLAIELTQNGCRLYTRRAEIIEAVDNALLGRFDPTQIAHAMQFRTHALRLRRDATVGRSYTVLHFALSDELVLHTYRTWLRLRAATVCG